MASPPAASGTANEGVESISAGLPNGKKGEVFKDEKPWVERYDYLQSFGYQLRPRYRPGWKASWKGVGPSATDEDGIPLSVRAKVMDARRMSDGTVVMMKKVDKTSQELRILQVLSSPEIRDDPRNHSIPLLDVLDDPLDESKSLMVFPLLRKVTEPPFASVGDCVDFVTQALEGLAFLHSHEIAHRDCFVGNIMMDGRALYPKGWHPQMTVRAPNGPMLSFVPKRQSVGGVRYYLIDFGISVISQQEATGDLGQQRAPELSETVPYNPFKVDIWLLGLCFNTLLTDKYKGLDWIEPLTKSMTDQDPEARPTINECVDQFKAIQEKISALARARRLHPIKSEWKVAEIVRDASYLLLEGVWSLKGDKKQPPPFKVTERPSPDLPPTSE